MSDDGACYSLAKQICSILSPATETAIQHCMFVLKMKMSARSDPFLSVLSQVQALAVVYWRRGDMDRACLLSRIPHRPLDHFNCREGETVMP